MLQLNFDISNQIFKVMFRPFDEIVRLLNYEGRGFIQMFTEFSKAENDGIAIVSRSLKDDKQGQGQDRDGDSEGIVE